MERQRRGRADAQRERAPEAAPRAQEPLLELGGAVGNRAVATLLQAAPGAVLQRLPAGARSYPVRVIQRDAASAAKALVDAGNVKLNERDFLKWLKQKAGKGSAAQTNDVLHEVTRDSFAAVQTHFTQLRQAADAAKKLDAANKKKEQGLKDAAGVALDYEGGPFQGRVIVNLDVDQLKHQPPGYRIGTREKGGGTKFPKSLEPDEAWHTRNTLPTMGQWAAALGMQDGDVTHTNQSKPYPDGNHYEGFCVQVAGERYVFFHCYPPK